MKERTRGSLPGLVDPEAVDDSPDPSDNDHAQEPLEEAEDEGAAGELVTGAGRDACADASHAGDDVDTEADNGESVIELDNTVLAASDCLIADFLGLLHRVRHD